jgi:predicted Zn-ribbon and HTH transcriptional regulator
MVNCPKCNSNDVDHATTGLPDAMQCLDCGYLFHTQVMGLMSAWPFPTSLKPQKHGLPKYNPNNEPDAPM